MLGDVLSEASERRKGLLILLGLLVVSLVCVAVGVAVESASVLIVLGIAVLGASIALLGQLVVASHEWLREAGDQLAGLSDRYDGTAAWLEQFDTDTRRAFAAAEKLHADLAARQAALTDELAASRKAVSAAEKSVAELRSSTVSTADLESRLTGELKTQREATLAAAAKHTDAAAEKLASALRDEASSSVGELRTELREGLEAAERSRSTELESAREGLSADVASVSAKADEAASAAKKAVGDAAEAKKAAGESLAAAQSLGSKLDESNGRAAEESKNLVGSLRGELVEEMASRIGASVNELGLEQKFASTERVENDLRTLRDGIAEESETIRRVRGDGYVQFPRVLSGEAVTTLLDRKLSADERELRYLERKLHVIEGLCEGRLAGSVDDAVARVLAARSVTGDELRVLEIGVLFGIGSLFMHHALSPFYERVRLTLLDPFDGYYGSDHVDPLTRQPVTRAAVERNLRRAGVPAGDVEFIPRFSTDDDALEHARADGPYGVVLIDGDHSAEGVRADFERYADQVAAGGVLIVDDVGSPDWPAVTEFAEQVVDRDSRFERLLLVGKTAAYRRLARAGKSRRGGSSPKPGAKKRKPGSEPSSPATKTPTPENESPVAGAVKKPAPKKAAAGKPAAKKATTKKPAASKTAAKKAGAKKSASKNMGAARTPGGGSSQVEAKPAVRETSSS